jgi:hypothetical protein
MNVNAASEGTPWPWTLAFGYHEDRVPTHRLRGRAFLETVRSASTAPVDFRGLAQNLAHAFMRRMELDPALVDRRPQLTPTASSCRQS